MENRLFYLLVSYRIITTISYVAYFLLHEITTMVKLSISTSRPFVCIICDSTCFSNQYYKSSLLIYFDHGRGNIISSLSNE